LWGNDFKLLEGAILWLYVGPPTLELRHVTEEGFL
jgi:hypothetical protein